MEWLFEEEAEPKGTVKAEYVKCKTCDRWTTHDNDLGLIDIHGQPHDHEEASRRLEERDGQQVLIRTYPPDFHGPRPPKPIKGRKKKKAKGKYRRT